MRTNSDLSNHSNIAYDYRIIIIIHEYEIFTEYKIYLIVCLGMSIGTQLLQHIVYRY